jgi:glycosyltransferase involved in cell wall biosynthesis
MIVALPQSDMTEETVSVIIPAFNAEATIDETLRSVRAQTYCRLEIAVVDDGSTDRTAQIVRAHAKADPRIHLYSQPNAGVAAARNLGVARTSGAYVAPIDADDLWAPTKIERQVRLMTCSRKRLGLVYTWFCVINEAGRVQMHEFRADAEGSVLAELLRRNLVGSGSALMRRRAIEEAGGYDTALRGAGAEGCEDYKLYLAIAERYEFAVVRDYLTGYRELPASMSGDVPKMVRSRDLTIADYAVRYPELRDDIRLGRIRFLRFMIARCWRQRRTATALKLLTDMMRVHPIQAIQIMWELLADRSERRERAEFGQLQARFQIGDPECIPPAVPASNAQYPHKVIG